MDSPDVDSQALTLRDDALIPILDSFLRGSSLNHAFSSFYRNSAPLFKDIDGEFTLRQKTCHQEYCDALEALIEKRLGEVRREGGGMRGDEGG